MALVVCRKHIGSTTQCIFPEQKYIFFASLQRFLFNIFTKDKQIL
jgi:hypothetical protein